jgi:hypothetical protein
MSLSSFIFLVAGTFNLASAGACVQISEDTKRLACFDATEACAAIRSDSDRLDCFDNAYAREESSISRPVQQDAPAVVSVESDPKLQQAKPIEDHPAEGHKPGASEIYDSPEEFASRNKTDDQEETLTAVIVDVTTDPRGVDYLRLDNGHLWRETENSRVRFKAGNEVTIESGIFGSFNLKMEGTNKIVKVRRVE